MTDKERVEEAYAKVKEKYPDISDTDEITALAIKLDKRKTLRRCLVFLALAAAMVLLGFISRTFITGENESQYYAFGAAAMCIFECFRTFTKFSKSEKLFKPVVTVKHEGVLTKDRIMEDGKKVFNKEGEDFDVFRLPLADMSDTYDINPEYFFHFNHPESNISLSWKVKADTYVNSALGTEYYVVVTPKNTVAYAYQATNWTIDDSVKAYIRTPEPSAESAAISYPFSDNNAVPEPAYQTEISQSDIENNKKLKIMSVSAIALPIIAQFTPFIVGLPLSIAALVLGVISITKQRSWLSIAGFAVSLICLVVAIIGFFTLVFQ